MADVKVTIDEDAIREMARSWDSPIGEAVRAAGEHVADYQRLTAPISAKGSKYAPPGFVKSRISESESHDGDGVVQALVGTVSNKRGGAYPYPVAFFSNRKGFTWNRGRHSRRPARNRFIQDSLNSLATFYYHARGR